MSNWKYSNGTSENIPNRFVFHLSADWEFVFLFAWPNMRNKERRGGKQQRTLHATRTIKPRFSYWLFRTFQRTYVDFATMAKYKLVLERLTRVKGIYYTFHSLYERFGMVVVVVVFIVVWFKILSPYGYELKAA